MELLLNAVWLSIALASGVRLAIFAARENDRRRAIAVGIATICILTALFPIISITDDLQETIAAVEETAAVRRIVAAAALQLAAVVAPILASVIAFRLFLIGFVTLEPVTRPASPSAPVYSLRGPPSFF